MPRIRAKERDTILQSLRAGVVPRVGIQHVQVGRVKEIEAMISDIDRISEGGSSIRFVIGEYGSGKTFFLQLVRAIAHEKGLLTAFADLSPNRRLHSTGGHARSLYAELMRNVSTRNKPDGGALAGVVERFIIGAMQEANDKGINPKKVIQGRLEDISELVCGYDFAQVIAKYWEGHDSGNDQMKSDAVRWLRGEFSTKTDARTALGVRTIIDDANVYEMLKVLAKFAKLAGFQGLVVGLDECVNLWKMSNTQSRNANYEQILCILNDSLQGHNDSIGVIMAGTPEFLLDNRRGLYSYQALQSRLAENSFAKASGIIDYTATCLHLANLSQEELYVLLGRIRNVFASGEPTNNLIPDEAITAFMEHCARRIGEAYFRTPRTTIRSFVDLLSVLEQNPSLKWEGLVSDVVVVPDRDSSFDIMGDEPEKPVSNSLTRMNETTSVIQQDDNEGGLAQFKL